VSYDIATIRADLASALDPLVTAGTLVQVSPYALSEQSPPCAYVVAGPIKYDEGVQTDTVTMMVVALVNSFSQEESQMALDPLLGRGANSIKELIEAALGATYSVRVTEVSAPRPYVLDTSHGTSKAPVVGCEWTVEFLT